ncbi:MAG: cobalt-precorrin-5B (C(1))-methyltransferase CbiD [Desulfovibrio sp.]|nr:cobalt-precorrin-5B (C(1))-methyltransferase CbiD [Desulfovibrio sp.]
MNGPREGRTTGSCAAAAALAALRATEGEAPSRDVQIPLPPFVDAAPTLLTVPVSSAERLDGAAPYNPSLGCPMARAVVIKDAGDDPDVTHGAPIVATIYAGGDPLSLKTNAGKLDDVYLHGGPGVGVVTKSGLPVPIGEAAINPVPREQIRRALRMASASLSKLPPPIVVEISIPDGETLAKNTLNSRLGIVGGVSILGTYGIVRPYSAEAYKETIRRCLAAADPALPIVFSTGRRSEKALTRSYPSLPLSAFVQAGDLAEFSLREAAKLNPPFVVWGGFFGKIVKLAQGLPDTRAGLGDLDLSWIADLAGIAGTPAAREIAAANTARQALGILLASPVGRGTVREVLKLAKKRAEKWAGRKAIIHLFAENGEEVDRL